MYAIVKTGGKQYRVEQGQSLLIERLGAAAEGETVTLSPLLCVDGENVVDGDDLDKVSVQARVVGHERGPKLRVVKFKPKRGYKRRTGHRQELTRIEVTEINLGARKASASKGTARRRASTPKPVAAEAAPVTVPAEVEAAPAVEAAPPAPAETTTTTTEEETNGA